MIEYRDLSLTEEEAKVRLKTDRFTVRLYDDYWMDVKTDVTWEEAQACMHKETRNGTEYTNYPCYYAVFPSESRMLFDSP